MQESATHAATELGQRIEQSRPYYFLCRRLPDTEEDAGETGQRKTRVRRDKITNIATPTQRVVNYGFVSVSIFLEMFEQIVQS